MTALKVGILVGAVAASMLGAGDTEPSAVRPGALLAQADRFVGHTIVVDIVEPLRGPATAEQLERVEYGQVRVANLDFGGAELSLVPAAFRLWTIPTATAADSKSS